MGAATEERAGDGRRTLRLGRWRFEVRRRGRRGGSEETQPLRFQDRFAARAFVRRCLEEPRNERLLRELLQREHPEVGCWLDGGQLVDLLAGLLRSRRLDLVRRAGTPGSGSGAGAGAAGQESLTAAGVMEEVAKYGDLIKGGVDLATHLATDGVWAEPAVDILAAGGELLLQASIENAGEWFDFKDDNWWGETMLTAAAAGGLAGLITTAAVGGDDYGQDGAIWSAIAGGSAGGVAALTTALIGGEDAGSTVLETLAGVVVGGVAATAVYIATNEGPQDTDKFPEEEEYLLPYSGTQMCVQGNHGLISHTGSSEFAYDFGIPAGEPVLCAYPGTVHQVINCFDGNVSSNGNSQANLVVVAQDNGAYASYCHQIQFGARVKKGLRVEAGHTLGLAGSVGISMVNHVHFVVKVQTGPLNAKGEIIKNPTFQEGEITFSGSQPVKFKDASADGDDGIPRSYKRYASDNSDLGLVPGYEYGAAGMTQADHAAKIGDTDYCDPPDGIHHVT